MSSLVVKSRELEAYSEQFVIGVVDCKLLVASDLLPSYHSEQPSSQGQLRVLSRTFCGADEFQVLAAIPFLSHNACSRNSGNCHEFNSSKAVYTLDPSNQFIWAFAYGAYDKDQSPRQWMFRISASSGDYTPFKIDQLQTSESGAWEVCTGCRASRLQVVSQNTFILHDSNIIAWECIDSWNDFYEHSDYFHSIAINVDLECNTFSMTCSEHKFPSKYEPSDYSVQPLYNSFDEWCWLVNDILVVYNINTQQSHAYMPKRRASKRMRKAKSHNFKLVRQPPKGLQLVMEPNFTCSNTSFYIYDIELCHLTKTFGLTRTERSNPVPQSLIQINRDRCVQQSGIHLHKGVLYKFYANYCLTMFLRMPTLQEAAFVGLQKQWMAEEEEGVLFDGINAEQLNEELNINAIWF